MSTKRLDTLSDFIRHHVDVEVICPRCDHRRVFGPGELSLYWRRGGGENPRLIRFRCRRCGTRTLPQIAPTR